MNKKIIVAIDGVAGAGKSVTAKRLAERIGYTYINTGAMYRAVTLKLMQLGIDVEKISKKTDVLKQVLNTISIQFIDSIIFLDGQDVGDMINSNAVSKMSSILAQEKLVREYLARKQREIGKMKGIVMEGRDIGTVIFPDAELKIFMVASAKVRAERRAKELGVEAAAYKLIKKSLDERDQKDALRKNAPLKKATDAITIDTSLLSIEEQVEKIQKLVAEKIKD